MSQRSARYAGGGESSNEHGSAAKRPTDRRPDHNTTAASSAATGVRPLARARLRRGWVRRRKVPDHISATVHGLAQQKLMSGRMDAQSRESLDRRPTCTGDRSTLAARDASPRAAPQQRDTAWLLLFLVLGPECRGRLPSGMASACYPSRILGGRLGAGMSRENAGLSATRRTQ